MDEPYAAWITVDDLRADTSEAAEKIQDADDSELQRAVDLATFVLFKATAERWPGLADDICWPCARTNVASSWFYPRSSHSSGYGDGGLTWLWASSWGWCTCGLGPLCVCLSHVRITLGAWPVNEITAVTIDGVLLDPSTYRLDENRWLSRIDGLTWPAWQNLADPSFIVEFVKGRAPVAGAIAACTIYAMEIAKANLGEECNLPSRVASIVRQGTTVNFTSVTDLLANNLTGVPLVDTWIIAANGGVARPHAPAMVASPDIGRATWHG